MKGADEIGWHNHEQRALRVEMQLSEIAKIDFEKSMGMSQRALSNSFDPICQYSSLEELTLEISSEISANGLQLIRLIDKWDNFDEGFPFEYFTKPYRDAALYLALAEKFEIAGNRDAAQAFLNQAQYNLGLADAHSNILVELETRENRIAPLLRRHSELPKIKEKVASLLNELPSISPKTRSRKQAANKIIKQLQQHIKESNYVTEDISTETLVTWMTREANIREAFETSNSIK